MKCKCGSYAVNPHMHGRGDDNLDLCDVCYWKEKVKVLKKVITGWENSYGWKDQDYIDDAQELFNDTLKSLNIESEIK